MSADLELRHATVEDAGWLEALARSEAVAPSLATDAGAGLAAGLIHQDLH